MNNNTDFIVKDSGVREEYPSGMRRDTQENKPNYRLIDIPFLTRIANHLVKGAKKYGRENWRNANSMEELVRFEDSAFRHLMQWLSDERDEDHMAAVCFNLMAAEYVRERLAKQEEENAWMEANFLMEALRPHFESGFTMFMIKKGDIFHLHIEWCRSTRMIEYPISVTELKTIANKDRYITALVKELKDHIALYNMTRY